MDCIEREFLEKCKGKRINIITKNGHQQRGELLDFGDKTLLVRCDSFGDEEALFYKDNVSTIKTM